MQQKALTVVFGTYMNPELIIPTLDGLRDQTFKDFEVYIVDDNSPAASKKIERSKEIILNYSELDIHYIVNGANIGVPHVFRKWINLVKTKYFYITGAGDKLLPNALSLMVNFLETNHQASMVHGIETKPNGKKDAPLFESTGVYNSYIYLRSHLNNFGKFKVYSWSQASAMFRSELFKIWEVPVKSFHFWDFYFHCTYLLYSKKIGYLNEYLTIRHNDSNEDHIKKLPDFISKIERPYQALKFIEEHKTTLISQGHNVYVYLLIIKYKLVYYSFRYNLNFSESLFCFEKVVSHYFLIPVAFILNLLIIPLKYLFSSLKFIKNNFLKK